MEIGDTLGMSQRSGPPITPEQLDALPAEFQALLRTVIDHYEARIAEFKVEVAELKTEIARLKKTPESR